MKAELRRALAALVAAGLAACSAQGGRPAPYYPVREGEPLAARVDGEPIPARFVEQDLRLAESRDPSFASLPEPEREARRRQLRRRLAERWVDMFLVEREARRRGISVTKAEVDEELRAKGRGLDDPQKVEEMRRRYGVTVDDLRVRVRQRLYVRKLNRKLAEEVERSTREDEFVAFYRANTRLFLHPEQAYVRLIGTKDPARAERLLRRARAGEDFAELARRYSEHPTRSRGGEWGWIGRGSPQWDPVFKVRAGGVAGPVRSGRLWYVVKVERYRLPGVYPFEEVREQVRAMVLRQKLVRRQQEISRELRRRSRVEVLVP